MGLNILIIYDFLNHIFYYSSDEKVNFYPHRPQSANYNKKFWAQASKEDIDLTV